MVGLKRTAYDSLLIHDFRLRIVNQDEVRDSASIDAITLLVLSESHRAADNILRTLTISRAFVGSS